MNLINSYDENFDNISREIIENLRHFENSGHFLNMYHSYFAFSDLHSFSFFVITSFLFSYMSIKLVDQSKKPRIVYFQYKPSGNGLRTLRQHFVALKGDDFQCGDDTSHLFKDDSNLKSKNITTDRRLTCGSPIEFAHYTVRHSVKGTVGRCAFCGDKLNKSATKTVKTLLEKECKVSPSCGKSVCLSMNPY